MMKMTLWPLTTLVAVLNEKVSWTAASTVAVDRVIELIVSGPGERAGMSVVGGRNNFAFTASNLVPSLALG